MTEIEQLDHSDTDSNEVLNFESDPESETESDREFEEHLREMVALQPRNFSVDIRSIQTPKSSIENMIYNIKSIITGLGLLTVSLNRLSFRRDESEKYNEFAADTAHHEALDAKYIRDRIIHWELECLQIRGTETNDIQGGHGYEWIADEDQNFEPSKLTEGD